MAKKIPGATDMHRARPADGDSTTKGFRPGGKVAGTSAREAAAVLPERSGVHYGQLRRGPEDSEALSIRLLARGMDTPEDVQRVVDATVLDVANGVISNKTGNFILSAIKLKIGVWLQSFAQGKTFHLMPIPPTLDGPEIDMPESLDT